MASTGFIVDMDNFGNGGRQLRLRCSHTRLFCTLFWRPWFRASRQAKNLEADRVQSVSTVSKPPTGTAEERVMCGVGMLRLMLLEREKARTLTVARLGRGSPNDREESI